MSSKASKTREESWPVAPGEHAVTEFLGASPGAQSPFGDDLKFPLPVSRLRYTHPTADERPNLPE